MLGPREPWPERKSVPCARETRVAALPCTEKAPALKSLSAQGAV